MFYSSLKHGVIFPMIIIFIVLVVLVDIVLNILVVPTEDSAGIFMKRKLPPLEILPRSFVARSDVQRKKYENAWFRDLIVDGKQITNGDMAGLLKEQSLVGYLPRENAVSANGWWQSNNLGARSRKETAYRKSANKKRLLFFGDSYTQGSRVPQQNTFPYYLDHMETTIEVVNFGVDGYGMGQAYLRYTMLKDKLEYDHVLIVFVPGVSLWRDINVSRKVGGNWESYAIQPRFVKEQNELRLIASPYSSLQEMVEENRDSMHVTLQQHLEKYDAFYFASGYHKNSFLDWSVMYRLFRNYQLRTDRAKLLSAIETSESEAMQITKLIFARMRKEVQERGSDFSLIILPLRDQIAAYSLQPGYKNHWKKLVSYFCIDLTSCIDLMEKFQSIPMSNLDVGYDGSHYGPKANRAIAEFVHEKISIPVSVD